MALAIKNNNLLSKIANTVKNVTFFTNILVSIIFILWYGISIYTSLFNLPFLIAYSCLCAITIINFSAQIITFSRKLKKPKKFYRVLRLSKYTTNGAMILLNSYKIWFLSAALLLDVVFLFISAISWAVHIILEVIRILLEKAVNKISASVKQKVNLEKRKEQFATTKENLSIKKDNFLKSVDKSWKSLTDKFKKKEQSAIPQQVDNLEQPSAEILVQEEVSSLNE